jgi:hypothetical protein
LRGSVVALLVVSWVLFGGDAVLCRTRCRPLQTAK